MKVDKKGAVKGKSKAKGGKSKGKEKEKGVKMEVVAGGAKEDTADEMDIAQAEQPSAQASAANSAPDPAVSLPKASMAHLKPQEEKSLIAELGLNESPAASLVGAAPLQRGPVAPSSGGAPTSGGAGAACYGHDDSPYHPW